jgi:hypothetical protein
MPGVAMEGRAGCVLPAGANHPGPELGKREGPGSPRPGLSHMWGTDPVTTLLELIPMLVYPGKSRVAPCSDLRAAGGRVSVFTVTRRIPRRYTTARLDLMAPAARPGDDD